MYLFSLCLRKFPNAISVLSASTKWVTSSVVFSVCHCNIFGNSLAMKRDFVLAEEDFKRGLLVLVQARGEGSKFFS